MYLSIYLYMYTCILYIFSKKKIKLKVLPQKNKTSGYICFLQLPTFPFKNLPPICPTPVLFSPQFQNLGQWLGSSEWRWHTMRRRSKPELRNTPRSDSIVKEYVVPPPDKGVGCVVVVLKGNWTNFIFQANHFFQWVFFVFQGWDNSGLNLIRWVIIRKVHSPSI